MDSFDCTGTVVEAQGVLRRRSKLSWPDWISFRRKNFPWKGSVATFQENERELRWQDLERLAMLRSDCERVFDAGTAGSTQLET
jgi:hypothetical protein